MTSLNNFKMDGRNVDEPVSFLRKFKNFSSSDNFSGQVIGGMPSLDAMLGDLQEDMTKQGVKTQQKGVCAACEKPIVGQVSAGL